MAEKTDVKMKNKWLALAFLALSVSLIVIDGTIVNVAIPVIMKDLKLNFTQVEWITTIYSLIFSALLITTGRIADDIGRKKTLIIGLVTFVAGSIIASFSKGIEFMLFARFIQGIGGAIVLPTTLSTVNSTFFGRDRVIAFAVWGSVISGMAAIGPLLGGFFTTYATWQWIFLINVPLGIVIIIGAIKYIPETFGEKMKGKFDFLGFILSSVGLAAVVYGLIEGRNFGWWTAKNSADAIFGLSRIPILLAIGAISLILFVVWEYRQVKNGKTHLLDMTLFGFKSFSLGNLIACIVAIGEFGLLFVLPIFMQNVLGFTSMKAGFILAAMGVGAFLSGGFASHLGKKISAARVSSIGLFLESIGLLGFFLTIKPDTSVWFIVLWLVVYGIGLGLASAQLTSTVLVDVPPVKSGQGSATQSTVRQLGSALGVAIMGTILVGFLNTNVTNSLDGIGLPKQMTSGIETSIINTAGASIGGLKNSESLSRMPQQVKNEMFNRIDDSFTKSSVQTIGIASGVLFAGFALTLGLPKKKASEN